MRQDFSAVAVETDGPGLHEATQPIADWVAGCGIADGLLTVFIQHTSASLLIQENADPDVLHDLQDAFAALAPHDPSRYRHGTEGPDDMPAHIRSALTQCSLTIPVTGGAMALGTWQGIYVFEHRSRPHTRHLRLHLLGE